MLHGQPPCFIEAVEYCLDFQDQNTELELTNKATPQKIAAAVVAPFQRDLQSSRMAAPSSGKAWQFISLEAGVREVIAASGIGETQMLWNASRALQAVLARHEEYSPCRIQELRWAAFHDLGKSG